MTRLRNFGNRCCEFCVCEWQRQGSRSNVKQVHSAQSVPKRRADRWQHRIGPSHYTAIHLWLHLLWSCPLTQSKLAQSSHKWSPNLTPAPLSFDMTCPWRAFKKSPQTCLTCVSVGSFWDRNSNRKMTTTESLKKVCSRLRDPASWMWVHATWD